MAFRNLSTSSIFTGTKSSKLWDQTTFPGTFESISAVTAGSTTLSSITFNNIPQNYSHLQIRGLLKRSTIGSINDLSITINSQNSGYSWHTLRGTNSVAVSAAGASSSSISLPQQVIGPISGSTDSFSAFIIDFLDYSSSNKNKVIRSLGGFHYPPNGSVGLGSGLWSSTNPITSITISSGSFQTRSSLALYGIRSA